MMNFAALDKHTRYKAPSLSKALDVLELLSNEITPLNISQIAKKLGRSVSEIYRIVIILETRGYLKLRDYEGYVLSKAPMSISNPEQARQNILDLSLTVMKHVTATTAQACYLSVLSGSEVVVVATVASPGGLEVSIREGSHLSLAKSTPGKAIYSLLSDNHKAFLEARGAVTGIPSAARVTGNADAGKEHGKTTGMDGGAQIIAMKGDPAGYFRGRLFNTDITEVAIPLQVAPDEFAAITLIYIPGQASTPLEAAATELKQAMASALSEP